MAINTPPRVAPAINPLIPHLYGQRVFDGQPIGRGVYKFATVPASTDVPFKHNLDRIPQIMPELIAWEGFTPRMKRGTTPWTTTTVWLQFDTAGTVGIWIR